MLLITLIGIEKAGTGNQHFSNLREELQINGARVMSKIISKCTLLIIIMGFVTPALAVRDDVLVIVNDNSVDSPQVGSHYATQRDIAPQNIVHVNVPSGFFMNWTQFKIMRDQIIKHMQDNTFTTPNLQPVTCLDGEPPYYCQAAMDQMRANTKIKYIVTTKGVPTRMKVDGSGLSFSTNPTSVDNYLKYWLVRYFTTDTAFNFTEREVAFGNGSGMRIVDTANDGELIVGRVDGVTLQAAKDLVDRTLSAEQNGIFGRLYGTVYSRIWKNFGPSSSYMYPLPPSTSSDTLKLGWRYQMGIFGETRPECLDYLDFAGNLAAGKSPAHCTVHLNDDHSQPGSQVKARPAVGRAGSRQAFGIDALMYRGYKDGQAMSGGSFTDMLNWRKNDQCNVTLCENTVDPVACRAASTDVFGEINTDCVGTADGFMGTNFISWPFSYFTIWPTGYTGHKGGEYDKLAFSEVREDIGFNDNFSLWFGNTDQVNNPQCFSSSDFNGAPNANCSDERKLFLHQESNISPITIDTVSPQVFELSFQLKGENVTQGTNLNFSLQAFDATSGWVSYTAVLAGALSAGNSGWTQAVASIQIDPARHGAATITRIGFDISSNIFVGDLGIDVVSLKDLSTGADYVINPEFDQGHKQNGTGDYASNILNRLNGVAAWGSVGHHQGGGGIFNGRMSDMVYFFRGLPLGDSIWFDEGFSGTNSAILYGDPLYSPVAIRINPVNATNTAMGNVDLVGSTINGRDSNLIATSYSIDYCRGTAYQEFDFSVFPALIINKESADFFDCDQNASWFPTGISGSAAVDNGSIGTWDATSMPTGTYLLRLAVTSTNNVRGTSQTFNDFYSIDIEQDSDADGVADINDNCTLVANGPNTYPVGDPRSQRDSNGNGFGNKCDTDYNNDGVTNLSDFSLLRANFGASNIVTGSLQDHIDGDGDGFVGLSDFSAFRSQFGSAPGPAGAL